ncbi:Intracellular septation protein A [Magnetococcus marinus MC-1]|uniref:Inner membrane-spanning protein YciB n=1 Tax=Magnetococcus marinus (strain ATCC BAA-1437 / JCM 17883 / MC-1) TaxID=156889 RepID=YCIB_MAGMM|nr:septation protein A [Magnetococcus marinus]A0LD93.1 RecName: Full=Inner membrane-spanning protein YciB [Magnetococcus marinus MC-1]ABK45936.1 Intracellular septation protein A [Magnetococcus marinus MC-1]
MRFALELLAIVVFFVVYKLDGIYSATAALIIMVLLNVFYHWFKHRHVPSMMWITLILVMLFGGATLIFHDPLFIKWKPSILQWVLASGFLASHLIGKRVLVARMLDNQISMPSLHWRRLNAAWVLFLLFSGALNLYVAYTFSEEIWVSFKLFGLMGLTILFLIGQAFYMSRHGSEVRVEERKEGMIEAEETVENRPE